MAHFSYLQFQRKYANRFIARRNQKVLASGKTMKELLAQLRAREIPYNSSITIGHVPPKKVVCIYVVKLSA